MDINWSDAITQIVAVVIGGALVIVANELAERRRRISRYQELAQHERAIYTAIHSVRNFVAEALGGDEEELGASERQPADIDWNALRSAQDHLHRLIEKSQPESQLLLHVVIEMSLRVDDLLRFLDSTADREDTTVARQLTRKANAVLAALETFDLVTAESLTYISEEELRDMPEIQVDELRREAPRNS